MLGNMERGYTDDPKQVTHLTPRAYCDIIYAADATPTNMTQIARSYQLSPVLRNVFPR